MRPFYTSQVLDLQVRTINTVTTRIEDFRLQSASNAMAAPLLRQAAITLQKAIDAINMRHDYDAVLIHLYDAYKALEEITVTAQDGSDESEAHKPYFNLDVPELAILHEMLNTVHRQVRSIHSYIRDRTDFLESA